MRFLITGCGRSGTKYMATVLQTIGLDVGHEKLGRDGAVSGVWNVDTDIPYPKFHPQGPRPHFDLILHQVRHPLPSIGSITTTGLGKGGGWRPITNFIPISFEESVLSRSAKYWLYWNRIAQDQAIFTYRIENLQGVWPHLMELLGVEADYGQIAHLSRSINSRRHRVVTWNDLEEELSRPTFTAIRALGRSYGYEID